MSQPELSIVIPFLNEEQVLPLLRERLEKLKNRPITWELLFVSDGSTDGSTEFIEAWAQQDASVKLVVLARNFGHQNAVSAGLCYASGSCVGIMDADLQDEPEVLLEMYHLLLSEKVDVVYRYTKQSTRDEGKAASVFAFLSAHVFRPIAPSRWTAAISA
jgi:Glycosyltransferases involved in cell wall biogenesis